MAQFGPPSIAGTIDSTVDAIGGGIRDYRTGQALENLPKTADGSVDYRAAAAAMYRTNPGLAAAFLKMDEHRSLEGYRRDSLKIQQQNADTAADKTGVHDTGDQLIWTDRRGQPLKIYDKETKQFLTPGAGSTQAPQTPQFKQPTQEHIDLLKANPAMAPLFDDPKAYGPGASARILGGGTAAPAPTATAPAAPQAGPAPLPPLPPGISYTEKKEARKNQLKERTSIDNAELKKADDNIQSGRVTLQTIGEMLELNKTAKHGPGALLRGHIGSLTGIGGAKAGADTVILQNKITGGALEQLRATFGGNPTEGERAILLQVQGSVGQAADVRDRIFKDAAELVRRRIKFNQKYANAQRSGQYLDPTYTDNTPVD